MRLLLTQLLTLLASLVLAVAAHASGAVAGHLDYSIDSKAEFSSYSQSGQRLQYVVLQPWQPEMLRALKEANPELKVLVYQNLLGSVKGMTGNGFAATPVLYEEADSSHPDWFLKNSDGNRFTLRNYPYLWAMDVGNAGYQQRWAEKAIATVKSQGWDGIFIDNVDPTLKYYANVPSVAKYPNDTAYSAATQSALEHITPQLQAAHMLVFANFGSWSDYTETVTPWLKYVDGAMDEMFLKFSPTPGAGYRNEAGWTRQLEELKESQRRNKVFLAITHSAESDHSAALFGWATVLLGAEGKAAYEMADDYAEETWIPEYEYDIGEPLGAETRDSDGVHRRLFSRGLVLVNPTSVTREVSFNGVYSGSGLEAATETTMGPHTGLVLLRVSIQNTASNPSVPALGDHLVAGPIPIEEIGAAKAARGATAASKARHRRAARHRQRHRRNRDRHRGEHGGTNLGMLESLSRPLH